MKTRRPRLSYANVAATLALVVAASMGGAYAHGKIGSWHIKDNAVKPRHIAGKAVKNSDLGKRAVSTNRIKAGAVTRGKLAPNAQTKVFEYRLGAHDFSAEGGDEACADLELTRGQIRSSVWTAQLDDRFFAGHPTQDDITYPVPGWGEYGDSTYRIYVQAGVTSAGNSNTFACVVRETGLGEAYDRVRLIRTVPTHRQTVEAGGFEPFRKR